MIKIFNYSLDGFGMDGGVEFSLPFFKGTYMIDLAFVSAPYRVYYGDEVDLFFWESLGLKIGGVNIPENPYTLNSGWKYDYYPLIHSFYIYDESSILVFSVNNVTTIADMNIDFNVHKSHQMRFIYDYSVISTRVPIPVDKITPDKNASLVDVVSDGVNNTAFGIDFADLIPFGLDLAFLLGDSIDDYQEVYGIVLSFIYTCFTALTGVNWYESRPSNQFYRDGYDLGVGIKQPNVKNAYTFKWEYLLPVLGVNMFPLLLPTQREDAISNNWPLYEPWLIIGYELVYAKKRDSDDGYGLMLFDLSPRYT